jgi:hypothetical protein
VLASALTRAGAITVLACSALIAQPGPGAAPVAELRVSRGTAGSPVARTIDILDLLSDRRQSFLSSQMSARSDSLVSSARRGAGIDARIRRFDPEPVLVRLWANSARSRQDRDGPVWQGRGLTTAVSGGMTVQWPWLSVALRPVAFLTQNASFTPDPAPTSPTSLRDPAWGSLIDLPYRMGTSAYGNWHPGESFLRVGRERVGAGITTASERWGPAERFPLVLGTEAGGFPRAFLHLTDIPAGVGHVQLRWLFGLLGVSKEANVAADDRSRVASAMAMSLTPRWFNGLEVGGARFFHVRRQSGSIPWSSATWPLTGLLKSTSHADPDRSANQLASVFARIAPPGARLELYGEYYREDHNADLRDLIAEPDHDNAYSIGLRRGWRAGADLFALTIERANGRVTHLARLREQGPVGLHGILQEGHTYNGQPLASSAVIGGGGTYASLMRVGSQRSQYAELELLMGPQSGEGGLWKGRSYSESRLGVGTDWRRGGRWLGWEAGLGIDHGEKSRLNMTLAARVR